MAELVVVGGPLAGLALPLTGSEHVLGRDEEASLVLPDESVSRRHCLLAREEGGWVLSDLGSLNATHVNGAAITRHVLSDGDVLRVGDSELTFVDDSGVLVPRAGDGPTLRVPATFDGAAEPPRSWRADRLADLLRLNEQVAAADEVRELFDALGQLLRRALAARYVAVYRCAPERMRVVWSTGERSGGVQTSQVLDAGAIAEAVEGGRTAWVAESRALITPIGGPPARYVAVAELSRDDRATLADWDARLAACAARLCGSAVERTERVAVLERGEEVTLVVDDEASIVTRSPAMQAAIERIERAAAVDVTVLILGESGTGKELAARAIHARSHRAAARFVPVNCAALPEALAESELFGHERGAFTGAVSAHVGRFERANGGTLFLDEVGELTPAAQARLLRVLETRTLERVGGTRPVEVDVRIVAATNRDLRRMCAEGSFREDLFYRLAVVTLELPPLRERREDIPLLAEQLLERARERFGSGPTGFDAGALEVLAAQPWPGNVRELRNAAEHAAVMAAGPHIEAGDLPRYLASPPEPADGSPELALPMALRDLERHAVVAALEASGGNKSQAARILGINRATLYAKLSQYGIA